MTCVRCGDGRQWHCKADGSNVRNAQCPAFLERWDEEAAQQAPAPVSHDATVAVEAVFVPTPHILDEEA